MIEGRSEKQDNGKTITILKVSLSDYGMSISHLVSLAEECFGRLLANVETENAFEFGFEGDADAASFDGLTIDTHRIKCATLFFNIVESPSWQHKSK